MSELKATPGPWHGDGRENMTGDILVYAPEAKHGCRDICFIPEEGEQDRANAHLIASSPRLYAALEALVGLYGIRSVTDSTLIPDSYQREEIADAMRVLAQARGETQP